MCLLVIPANKQYIPKLENCLTNVENWPGMDKLDYMVQE